MHISGCIYLVVYNCLHISGCMYLVAELLVQQLCREEEVGFVDLWGHFVGRAYMYTRDGLHLSGKGAAMFADELSAAVESGMGSITKYICEHCLN